MLKNTYLCALKAKQLPPLFINVFFIMRLIYTLLFSIGFYCGLSAQVTTTLHQTILASGADEVSFALEGDIEIRETKGSRIIVETVISLESDNAALLDYLANSGRYDILQSVSEAESMITLTSKERTNVIIIKGKECNEEIKYVVYLPEGIKNTENLTAVNP